MELPGNRTKKRDGYAKWHVHQHLFLHHDIGAASQRVEVSDLVEHREPKTEAGNQAGTPRETKGYNSAL